MAILHYSGDSWTDVTTSCDTSTNIVCGTTTDLSMFLVARLIFYTCGDANGDGNVNVGDVIYIISHIYKGGPAPSPLEAADANCDGTVNVGDPVYLINHIFKGGKVPCDPDGDGQPDC
jgi:hypothetical protein